VKRPVAIAAAFVAALLAAPRRADAQTTSDPVRVVYEAPPECPNETSFFRALAARTNRVRPAAADEPARVVRVRIAAVDGGVRGDVRIDEGDPRELTSHACADLVGALAFVGALAVDPTAGGRAASAPRTEGPEPPAPALASSSPSRAAAPSPASTTALALGAGAAVEVAYVADAVVAPRLHFDVTLARRTRGAPAALSPSARLAIARSFTVERRRDVAGAALSFTAASLDGCPVRATLSWLELRPCIGIAAGVLRATALGVAAPSTRTRPWAAATAFVRAAVPLGDVLWLEAEGGAMVPLVRDAFVVEPDVIAYEAPASAFFGRVGATVHFP